MLRRQSEIGRRTRRHTPSVTPRTSPETVPLKSFEHRLKAIGRQRNRGHSELDRVEIERELAHTVIHAGMNVGDISPDGDLEGIRASLGENLRVTGPRSEPKRAVFLRWDGSTAAHSKTRQLSGHQVFSALERAAFGPFSNHERSVVGADWSTRAAPGRSGQPP